MRIGIAIIMCLLSVALAVCAHSTKRSTKAIAPALRMLLLCLFPPVLGNLLIILTQKKMPALVGYYVYFTGMDYVMAALLTFTLQYCHMSWVKTWQKRLFNVLLLVDVVQLLCNLLFGHAFDVEMVMAYGAPYYCVVPLAGQSFHRLVCYSIFLIVLLIFLIKSLSVSRVYSERYSIILLTMLFTGIWETYYIYSRTPIDRSMIGYGVFGLMVFYFSLYYRPLRLLDRMLADVASGLPEALFFFSDSGQCVWANAQAQRFVDADESKLEDCRDKLLAVFPDIRLEGEEWSEERVRNADGETRYYELSRQIVRDPDGRPVGSLLNVRDNTEQERELQQERYNATHDSLTGFYTRDYLYQRIRETLDENPDKTYTVSYMDIDDFKLVNDVFGREFGDLAIRTLADSLRSLLPPNALYGRLSGDCFGLLIEMSDFDAEKAARFMDGFTVKNEEVEHTLLIHQGVYVVTERDIDVSLMFDRAHMALVTIKNQYKFHVAVYDDAMREKTLWEQRISEQLQSAIEQRQIRPYLQVIVDSDGQVVGAEALVRWIHPVDGFLSPASFIPTFESNGMIADVDRYMWHCAGEILYRWQELGDEKIFISVNISPKDFYFMDVVGELKSIVKEYGIPASRLRVEITETVMMTESLNRIEILNRLKEAGFLVEMDDFGSGYSSLNMLKDMPVDVVKIDMAFLTKTKDSQRAHVILDNVMNMTNDLEILSLTEGVEKEEQYRMLSGMGCRLFQGYYFAKPMPLEQFEEQFMADRLSAKA